MSIHILTKLFQRYELTAQGGPDSLKTLEHALRNKMKVAKEGDYFHAFEIGGLLSYVENQHQGHSTYSVLEDLRNQGLDLKSEEGHVLIRLY